MASRPFPIQALTCRSRWIGHDLIGQAKTGTGKTLGFGVPLLQALDDEPRPARRHARSSSCPPGSWASRWPTTSDRGVEPGTKVVAIYGGRAYEGQIEALPAGAQLVVGTPGRLLDLVAGPPGPVRASRCWSSTRPTRCSTSASSPTSRSFSLTPPQRQTMLFSATMPGEIVTLARRYMNRPIHIRATNPTSRPRADIKHLVYRAHSIDKIEVLARILQAEGRGLTIVFTRTKRAADQVADRAHDRGFNAARRARRPGPGPARARHARVQERARKTS